MKRLITGTVSALVLTSMAFATTTVDPEAVGTSSTIAASNTVTAYPATMPVLLDDVQVSPVGYNINGNNYYKLRDIAYLMNGKSCQFDVTWDRDTRSMNLLAGASYHPDGNELGAIPTKQQTALPSRETVLIDGKPASLAAYNVDGYNYFKLVDLGQALHFTVDYDAKSRTVLIHTSSMESSAPQIPDVQEPSETPPPPPPISAVDGVLKIWIDPGHGGTDSGNVATAVMDFDDYWGKHYTANEKILEKDFNLAVSLMLQDMLKQAGVEVRMTRTDDTTVEPSTRKQLFSAEGGQYDMIFSVHHNGFHTATPQGAEVLIQIAYENGGAGKEFGELLKQEYLNMGQSFRNLVFKHSASDPTKDYYFVLRSAQEGNALAFISEFCFMSNPEDQRLILSVDNLRAQAQAQYNAIMKFFETHPY